MRLAHRQRGISIWGLLFVAVVFGFAGFVGLKLFPVYMESIKIDKAIEGVMKEGNIGSMSKTEIQRALLRRFQIDDITRIRQGNIGEYVVVNKKNQNVSIEIFYRAETPLVGNLSLVAEFDKYAEN